MKTFIRWFCLPLLLGAYPLAAAHGQEDKKQLATKARELLNTYCYKCHHGPGSPSGYEFDVLKDKTLTTKIEDNDPVVVAGKAKESRLWQVVQFNSMPPKSQGKRLSDADKALLTAWIDAGAPSFALTESTRKFIPVSDVLTVMRDYLRNADKQKRPYLRFFTLTHLHNNPSVQDRDLAIYRAALSKAVNSLSNKARIVVSQAIDKEAQTVFVLDVRDLDWDRHNLWYEIIRQYPYGLKYRPGHPLQKLDEEISDYTGCDLAYVRGDWFAATATRPPLYHTLLFDEYLPALRSRRTDPVAAKQGNPKRMTARDLEAYLDVHIANNFLDPTPERIARAGFAKSGVSGQNRLLERCDAKTGAYWKSYDFKEANRRSKLTRFPLGPLNLFPHGHHPYADQAFIHDGGEAIFNLPNGLQGYMLVNGKDERIDEGPVEVVNDSQKTSGTPAIVNGLSCMACHKNGMIPFKDTLREGNAVFGKPLEKVELLYPEQKKLNELVQSDERRFLDALDRAIGPFFRDGVGKDKPIKEWPEPVADIAMRYRLVYLDLQTVASELDLAKPTDLLTKLGEKKIKQLGLEPLLKEGGLISRAEWEALEGISLMQETARELRATPFRP
jgi:serine/threonine-protein kinase